MSRPGQYRKILVTKQEAETLASSSRPIALSTLRGKIGERLWRPVEDELRRRGEWHPYLNRSVPGSPFTPEERVLIRRAMNPHPKPPTVTAHKSKLHGEVFYLLLIDDQIVAFTLGDSQGR